MQSNVNANKGTTVVFNYYHALNYQISKKACSCSLLLPTKEHWNYVATVYYYDSRTANPTCGFPALRSAIKSAIDFPCTIVNQSEEKI